jgi:hypothetical protein
LTYLRNINPSRTKIFLKELESIVEEYVEVKSHGKSDTHFIVGREEEHHLVRKFPGFARSSL